MSFLLPLLSAWYGSANLTLQVRLVKELRLEGISTLPAANAYTPIITADYKRRFPKPPRSDLVCFDRSGRTRILI
jgi:hypothetical protein